MTMLEKLNAMSNSELLDMFALLVKVEYYDPFHTPVKAKDCFNEGISSDDVKNLLLSRLEK